MRCDMADDIPTRDELIEALLNLSHAAQREFPVVGPITYGVPTPWDRRHAGINWRLDQLDMLASLDGLEVVSDG